MKELSIEQKAHRYDEALEKAKTMIDDLRKGEDILSVSNLEAMFPELKESEDERIRKDIIHLVQKSHEQGGYAIHKYEADEMLAWLEKQGQTFTKKDVDDAYLKGVCDAKQGEHNPTDKAEPKFKVGDFIVNDYCMGRVIELTNDAYLLDTEQGIPFSYEHNVHLWTIQDAKDGDVLVAKDKDKIKIFLYNGDFDLRGRVCAYCGIYRTYDGFRFTKCAIGNYFTYKEPHPATKEQRDLLFQKMEESGYEWDAEKKELRKIEQKHTLQPSYKSSTDAHLWTRAIDFDGKPMESKPYEQKPAWSEEDERMYRGLHNLIYSTPYCDSRKELSDFLDSLKNILQSNLQQEWTEEDKKCIRLSTDIIDSALRAGFCVQLDRDRCVDWLKSLRPQSAYKPSNEQIKALKEATDKHFDIDGDALWHLYEDLKKLKG